MVVALKVLVVAGVLMVEIAFLALILLMAVAVVVRIHPKLVKLVVQVEAVVAVMGAVAPVVRLLMVKGMLVVMEFIVPMVAVEAVVVLVVWAKLEICRVMAAMVWLMISPVQVFIMPVVVVVGMDRLGELAEVVSAVMVGFNNNLEQMVLQIEVEEAVVVGLIRSLAAMVVLAL